MEGSQAPAPAPIPAEPKKNMIVIAAIAIIAVIVIVIAAVLLMGGEDDSGDDIGGDLTNWEPKVGDYYEYTTIMNGQEFTMRFRVTEVSSTTITMNITSTAMGMTSYSEETYPVGGQNEILSIIEDPEPGMTVVDKGMTMVYLDFGSFQAHHYKITTQYQGQSSTTDVYLYKGLLIKMWGEGGGVESSMEMTDTNIF